MKRFFDYPNERLDMAIEYPIYRGQKIGICGAQMPGDTYYCTRPRNHQGPHVAHSAPDSASAMWTDKGGRMMAGYRPYTEDERADKAKQYPSCIDQERSEFDECGDTSPDYGYLCTRPKGHDGPHVAHGTTALGEWDRAEN